MIINDHPIYIRATGKHIGFIVHSDHGDYILANPFIGSELYGISTQDGEECRIPKKDLFDKTMWIQADDVYDWFPQAIKDNFTFVYDEGLESLN